VSSATQAERQAEQVRILFCAHGPRWGNVLKSCILDKQSIVARIPMSDLYLPFCPLNQLTCMEKYLAGSRSSYLIVAGHYPVYSIGEIKLSTRTMNCVVRAALTFAERELLASA